MHDDVALLREPRELRRALADLRDAARRRGERLGVRGLDRVDDDDLGGFLADRRDDRLELDFGEQRHRRVDQTEPLRAQRDLLDRLLAGDVERLLRRADRCHRLQQQRRLADAGIAAQQDDAAGDEAAAQHAVELLEAGRKPRRLLRIDAAERAHRDWPCRSPSGTAWPAAPRPFRPACSRRCNAGTGPATSGSGRRTRCSCRRSWPPSPGRRDQHGLRLLSVTIRGTSGTRYRRGHPAPDADAVTRVRRASRPRYRACRPRRPAASFAMRTAVGRSAPAPSSAPSVAMTVSPAPRHVVHLARDRRNVLRAVRRVQAHAFLRARDEQRRRRRARCAAACALAAISRASRPAADHLPELAAIGRDHRRAAVPRPSRRPSDRPAPACPPRARARSSSRCARGRPCRSPTG